MVFNLPVTASGAVLRPARLPSSRRPLSFLLRHAVQSRTNDMASVPSRQIKSVKHSGVTHVNFNGRQSAATLWLRRETRSERTRLAQRRTYDPCTRGRSGRVYGVGPPTDGRRGQFLTWHQGCQDIRQKHPEGRGPPFSRHNRGRLQATAEGAEPHTPEGRSTPCRSHWASGAGGSASLDGGLRLPCCPPGSGGPCPPC